MSSKALHLWCAYPGDLADESAAEGCAALLNEEEQERWRRFKFERHRRESLATKALARTALSYYRPVASQDWRFVANAHGKPAVEPDCGLRFNLSNSIGLVVCLIGEGVDVGVDVEPFDRADAMLNVATEVFSAAERTQLEALPDEKKLDRAVSLWTLKEAYIKARGMGLAIPLDQFSFLFGRDDGITLEIDSGLKDDPGRWRFFILDHAGHRIAGVVEHGAPACLDVLEARPVLAPPARAEGYTVRWFPRSAEAQGIGNRE